MPGSDHHKHDAADNLVIDALYRLTRALAGDTENALATGKDYMLQRAITKELQLKNDDLLGLVLKQCYEQEDYITRDLFNLLVERYSTATAVTLDDGTPTTSFLFAIPVTVARTDDTVDLGFTKSVACDTLCDSVARLCVPNGGRCQVVLSEYLYHPAEIAKMNPSDLYGFHQGVVNVAQGGLTEEQIKATLCEYGHPKHAPSVDALAIELFYLLGVARVDSDDPFMQVDDQVMLAWRSNTSSVVETCLGLTPDSGFVLLGDVDLLYQGVRNGAIEHKEFAFDLKVENLVMRDKFPPQAISVLITQFGDDDTVEQVHVSLASVLDNVLRCGFVYHMEAFENTGDVIDNMINTLNDWDVTHIQVMDKVLPYEEAYGDDGAVFLLPKQINLDAGIVEIDGKKERLLH